MTIITKIEVQKNNKERYSIYIDKGSGEEYGFGVNEQTLIKHSLKKGMEIDELALATIIFDEEVQKAYLQAISYLSYQMRTRQEVEEHLHNKETGQAIIAEVINRLLGEAYLNDQEYAAAYVQTQSTVSAKGPKRIARELQEKGVAVDLITNSLHEYSKDKQIANAVMLLEKKKRAYRNLSMLQQKQKLEEMLLRKGYTRDVIGIAFAEVQEDQESNEQWEALLYQGQKYHEKYKRYSGYEYETKMKGALYRKGFPLELIERFLQKQVEDL